MKICILGAGPVGQNLGKLAVEKGHEVTFGLRNPGEFEGNLSAAPMVEAIEPADLVILALPYLVCHDVLPPLASHLEGKTVVDATNPLNPDYSPVILGAENSAGEEIARLLPGANVVKAFNMIFANEMTAEGTNRDGLRSTIFVAGDDSASRNDVADFISELGFAPEVAGSMKNARYMEAMAHLNIAVAFGMERGANVAFVYHHGS